MIFCLSSLESIETSPVDPIINKALVPFDVWKSIKVRNPSKSTAPSRLNGVINATNEPSIFGFSISIIVHNCPSVCIVGHTAIEDLAYWKRPFGFKPTDMGEPCSCPKRSGELSHLWVCGAPEGALPRVCPGRREHRSPDHRAR